MTGSHQSSARESLGEREGTRSLIEVLLLHRQTVGAVPDSEDFEGGPQQARVISLLARLPGDARPAPSLTKYDRLLKRRATATEGTA
ncbi:hypothetical protein JJV70_17740 [Streptomyces sp. JJ66]|uniref:hypothetical protein n=1 Tax=Streptomyces sp. JJ66 TaxID=2803843 RepID=UPI001C56582E|nr:hypothetical protein [Streptomyces sp. JJ66]MBW1603912.1 hypothetical protein [Streptomyces sp. JJ66]